MRDTDYVFRRGKLDLKVQAKDSKRCHALEKADLKKGCGQFWLERGRNRFLAGKGEPKERASSLVGINFKG